MFKFLKKYWTHILNILLFVFFIVMFSMDNVLWSNEYNIFIWILIILELIFVIAIWGEIIYYIVYVAKNKDIPNRGVKALLIYLLCYWYIPCFKLKYIDKDNNYKKKNIIYVIGISILMIIFFIKVFSFTLGTTSTNNYKTYISDDKVVEFRLPSNYKKQNIGEYDLYFSKGIKVNMGVFLYDDWGYSDLDILNYQEDWLLSARDNLELVDNNSINEDGKEINTVVYESNSDVYTLSTISFDDKDDYVIYVILVSTADYYEKVSDELDNILVNIELKSDVY